MNCLICETRILKRDSFFWRLSHEVGDKANQESEGGVHDDCLIREAEFSGNIKYAKEIFNGSIITYKRIAEIARDFSQGQ